MPSPVEELRALLLLINSSAEEAISIYESTGSIPTLDTAEPIKAPEASASLKRSLRTLEAACNQLTSTLMPPDISMYTRSASVIDLACIRLAINKKIPDVLIKHAEGLGIDGLASETGIEEGKLLRIMRFLAARHCFREVAPATFANNPLSLSILSDTPLWNILNIRLNDWDPIGVDKFYEALTTPGYSHSYDPTRTPFSLGLKDIIPDGTCFEWLKQNPEQSALFNKGMGAMISISDADLIHKEFPWQDIPAGSTICDVGSGNGSVTLRVAKAHSHLRFTLQDQPHVLEDTKALWTKEHPSANDIASYVPINFLTSPPVKNQDVYFLRQIIHDWPRDECITILKNIRAAMKPTSRLLIHEYILSDTVPEKANGDVHRGVNEEKSEASTSLAKAPYPLLPNYGFGATRSGFLDLLMLTLFNASERNLDQFKELGQQAGLRFVKVWNIVETGIIEFARD